MYVSEEEESQEKGLSFRETIELVKDWLFYFLSNWWKIGIAALVFAGIGFLIAKFKPVNYSAKLSFVVEESKTTGGGLSSLAGQLGFDFNVGTGGSLISGENLLIFLKSNSLSKEVLLSPIEEGKNFSIADQYAEVYGYRKKWKINPKINTEVFFPANSIQPYSRLQDSLVQVIASRIIKEDLIVERPEKKASFVTVSVKTVSEPISAIYCKLLVQKAIERYILSKTKRQKTNVDRLQRRADSIEAVLNNKTFINATQQEQLLDINPASKTASVSAEVSSRDKLMLYTVYGEVTKNLELAKVQLNQETPTIQVVDNIQLPLTVIKKSKLIYFLIGGFLGAFLYIVFLSLKRLI
jgi:hypothetical protein